MEENKDITSEEFCMWLKGFLTAIQSAKQVGEEEVELILKALDTVKKMSNVQFIPSPFVTPTSVAPIDLTPKIIYGTSSNDITITSDNPDKCPTSTTIICQGNN